MAEKLLIDVEDKDVKDSLQHKFSFPKSARILSRKHFAGIMKAGHVCIGKTICMHWRRGKVSCPKLGITVSKRYGKAHDRNLFKRLVREAFREARPFLPSDLEVNISPRKPKLKIRKAELTLDIYLLR